jgi:hypothetical protein
LADNLPVVEKDGALSRWGQSDNGPEGGGLADTISAQESNDFPLINLEGDPLDDVAGALIGGDVPNLPKHKVNSYQ